MTHSWCIVPRSFKEEENRPAWYTLRAHVLGLHSNQSCYHSDRWWVCMICSSMDDKRRVPKVSIICGYIFLQFWLKTHFASTEFCDLYTEMVQGRQILMFYTTRVLIANDCGHKILHFWANPQKYQTLVPAKK
jgi:hypothetical protein